MTSMTDPVGKQKPRSDKKRTKKRTKEINEALGDYQNTEDVVLSLDDGHTPASVVIEVMEKGDLTEALDPKAKDQSSKKRRSPFKQVLGTLRKPELMMIQAYKKSGVRKRLLEKSAWYKNFEDNRIMGRTLEAAYGGASSRRLRLQRFVRNNLLFSLLLCVGLSYAGRVGVAHIMHPESRLDVTKTTNNDPATQPKSELSAEQMSQHRNASRKIIEVTLAHCSVHPDVRKALLTTLGDNFEFTNTELNQAMREFRRFQRRYRASGVTQWYQDAQIKSQITADALKTVLPGAQHFLSQKKTERRNKQLLLEKQELLLKQIDNTGPLQGVDRINERIQARDQVRNLQEQIDQGPTPTDLLALEDQLVSSRIILTATDTTENSAWNPQAPGVLEAQGLNVEATQAFASKITQDIDSLVSTETNATAKLDAYRVRNLRDQLRRLTVALAVNKSSPKALITAIKHSQQVLNERLDPLLSKHTKVVTGPIDYNGCLKPST
jgi:hypothetical protein